jgi:hypothetical protein
VLFLASCMPDVCISGWAGWLLGWSRFIHFSNIYLYSPFLDRGDDARIDIVLSASLSRWRIRAGTWQADGWSDEWWRPWAHRLSASRAARYHCRVHTAAGRVEHLVLQVQTLWIGWYCHWRSRVRSTTGCLHKR